MLIKEETPWTALRREFSHYADLPAVQRTAVHISPNRPSRNVQPAHSAVCSPRQQRILAVPQRGAYGSVPA